MQLSNQLTVADAKLEETCLGDSLALLPLGLVLDDRVVSGRFGFGHIGLLREVRREPEIFHLSLELVGASLDRHSGAMHPEREQAPLALDDTDDEIFTHMASYK